MILCFPDPHPDELLYSLWARFSDHVCYSSEKYILRELFGSDRIHPIIDLPCHLGLLTGKLPPDCKYTADYFIDQHTLFPLYSPFMSRERATALRELMIANESRGLPQGFYRRFGIVNSLVPRIQWLRYCPICWQEDKTTFGEAYWHRSHQVPGFEACPLHGTFIENSSFRIRLRNHSGKTLFSAASILPVASPRFVDSSPLGKALRGIAEDICYLLEHPGISLTLYLLNDQYRNLFAKQGYFKKGGAIRDTDILNAFEDYYTPALIHQFNCEMNENKPHSSWLIRLATVANGHQPPLHHLLTMHFLGATVKDFFNQKIQRPSPFGEGPWPCLNPACVHYHQRCVHTSHLNETQARENKPDGIFACICGFTYSRKGPDSQPGDAFRRDRVLSYGTVWEAKLKELWSDPTLTRREIARFLGTSEGNVTNQAIKLHLATPRISPRNREGKPRLVRDTQWYRTRWLNLLEAAPEKGLTALNREAPGLYAWLYSNDRDWFIAHRPPSKPSIIGQSPKKDLTFRSSQVELPQDEMSSDTIIAEAVKNAASQILLSPGHPRRVSKSAICSFVPQLAYLVRKPEKIPLTIQVLAEVTETYEKFAIRRIRWVMQQYQMEKVVPSRNDFLHETNFLQHIHLPSVKEAFESAMTELTSGL